VRRRKEVHSSLCTVDGLASQTAVQGIQTSSGPHGSIGHQSGLLAPTYCPVHGGRGKWALYSATETVTVTPCLDQSACSHQLDTPSSSWWVLAHQRVHITAMVAVGEFLWNVMSGVREITALYTRCPLMSYRLQRATGRRVNGVEQTAIVELWRMWDVLTMKVLLVTKRTKWFCLPLRISLQQWTRATSDVYVFGNLSLTKPYSMIHKSIDFTSTLPTLMVLLVPCDQWQAATTQLCTTFTRYPWVVAFINPPFLPCISWMSQWAANLSIKRTLLGLHPLCPLLSLVQVHFPMTSPHQSTYHTRLTLYIIPRKD